jgi:methionine synthase I (cobalamin-dependent)
VETYFEQVVGMVHGGVEILMVETVFDTLNAYGRPLCLRSASFWTKVV